MLRYKMMILQGFKIHLCSFGEFEAILENAIISVSSKTRYNENHVNKGPKYQLMTGHPLNQAICCMIIS